MKYKFLERDVFKKIDAPVSLRATGDGAVYPVKEKWVNGERWEFYTDVEYPSESADANEILREWAHP